MYNNEKKFENFIIQINKLQFGELSTESNRSIWTMTTFKPFVRNCMYVSMYVCVCIDTF